jgi:predicted outer membrane protein
LIAFVLVMSLACAGRSLAQGTETPTPSPTPSGDRAVIAEVVEYAVSMLSLCALAKERTTGNDVRSYCRNVSSDNERMAIAGLTVEQRLGDSGATLVPLPGTSDQLDTLGRRSGREFERELLLAQIVAGELQVRTLRYAVEFSTDGTVRSFARTALAHVQRHLDLAESTLRRVSESFP